LINLTWYNFFFEEYCHSPSADIDVRIENLICSPSPPNVTEKGFEYYKPGDSKISFTIEGWNFENDNNTLHSEIVYNTTNRIIPDFTIQDRGDRETFSYETEYGLILETTYLKKSLEDGTIDNVYLNISNPGSVKVIFTAFDEKLSYDPCLAFLFFGLTIQDRNGWLRFEGPLIAVGVCVLIGLAIILTAYNTEKGHEVILGYESLRVWKLREYTSSNGSEIDENQRRSAEAEIRSPARDNDLDHELPDGPSDGSGDSLELV
jgi:hypothetical protein